jgi:hypothetical protein
MDGWLAEDNIRTTILGVGFTDRVLCLRRLCEGDREQLGCTPSISLLHASRSSRQQPEYWPVYSTLFCALFNLFYFTTQTSFRQHTVLETNILRPTIHLYSCGVFFGCRQRNLGRCETGFWGGQLPFLIS